MSESNNGVAPESTSVEGAKKPRSPRRKAEKTSFYDLCRQHCTKKRFSLKASDADGAHTLSVPELPVLTKEGVLNAARSNGVNVATKHHDPIDGKSANSKSSADGESAVVVAEGFFAISDEDEEGQEG